MSVALLKVEWPAPTQVGAAFTLRSGGVSAAPWGTLNLGSHVGDMPAAVTENRQRVAAALALPAAPMWLQQVHGARVLNVASPATAPMEVADAAITRERGRVLAILVASDSSAALAKPSSCAPSWRRARICSMRALLSKRPACGPWSDARV